MELWLNTTNTAAVDAAIINCNDSLKDISKSIKHSILGLTAPRCILMVPIARYRDVHTLFPNSALNDVSYVEKNNVMIYVTLFLFINWPMLVIFAMWHNSSLCFHDSCLLFDSTVHAKGWLTDVLYVGALSVGFVL